MSEDRKILYTINGEEVFDGDVHPIDKPYGSRGFAYLLIGFCFAFIEFCAPVACATAFIAAKYVSGE
jgi:hypothetical protein